MENKDLPCNSESSKIVDGACGLPKITETKDVDNDLDSLLDSALEDFDKPIAKKPTKVKSDEVKSQDENSKIKQESGSCNEHPWGREFQQFQDAMRSFLADDPQLKDELQHFAESASKAASATSDEEFAASLAETLKSMAENAQTLSDPPSEDDVVRLLGGLDLDGAKGEDSVQNEGSVPDILPLMQNVMQSLLSKELLYPALHDIVDKYPDWLAEKRPSLDEKQYECYSRQYELMKQVCEEFEKEKEIDSESVKKARFERILMLMQKMQDCGHPPKELIREMGPELDFDEHGNLKLPGLKGDQCLLM